MTTTEVRPAAGRGPAPAPASAAERTEGWALVGRLAVLLPLALALLLVAFGWPVVHSGPHGVPLGLVGPARAVAQVEQGLARAAGADAFAVTTYPDDAALRTAIADRKVYGGLSLPPTGPRVLVASAGSPAVAQAVTALGAQLAEAQGTRPVTEDVVPLPADDPRGAGLAVAGLPLAVGGVLPAVVAVRTFRRRAGLRVAAAAAVSLVAGVVVAAVLSYGFGSVQSDRWAVAGALSLGMAAIALALVGLAAVAGRIGLAAGAAVVLLLGNPLSGLASAPELLPAGWGALGQVLPPGASATLLRSTAYFDGAAAGRPVLVLSAWVVLGLALCAAAALTGHHGHPGRHERVPAH